MLQLLALVVTIFGLGLFALSMPRHWRQIRNAKPLSTRFAGALRSGGALALMLSLLLCLASSHPTIAVLVWFMQLALAAVLLAMLFAGHPDVRAPK